MDSYSSLTEREKEILLQLSIGATNKDVMLRIMPADGGEIQVLAKLFGGQGSINVPSWSPDSKNVAFVSYRLIQP